MDKGLKYLSWCLGFLGISAILLFVTIFPILFIALAVAVSFALFFILMLCFAFCLLRLLLGPSAADRAVSVDTLGILIVGFCAILSIPTGRDWYIDIAIAWALQSFIGALALAKYLEGRGFDEEIIGYIFIVVGLVFDIFGCIGLIRLPDVYNRLQATTKCVTLGTCSILFGTLIIKGFTATGIKAILCIIFLLLTAPVAAHALSRGAHIAGVKLWGKSVCDKYAEDKQ